MAGMDLTSLVLAGAGAFVLAKAMEGSGNGQAFGQQPGTTTQQNTLSSTVLDQLQSAGVAVNPGDQVQQITTTTPAGQTVTFVTQNYNPWAPAANQTVYLNPLDPLRLQGIYIPQFPAWVVQAFGSETKALEFFTLYSQRIDVTGAPNESVYNFQMPIRDWDSLRLRADTREEPITASEAAAAGLSLDDMVTLNGYHGALQRVGGWVRGVEIHKGPRSRFQGLGAARRYYGKWY